MFNFHTYLANLLPTNKLFQRKGFKLVTVSGLDQINDLLAQMTKTVNFVALESISDGTLETNNTPMLERSHTVYISMRYKVDDSAARQRCVETMRDLFRQICSVLHTYPMFDNNEPVFLLPDIRFQEIPEYSLNGAALLQFIVTERQSISTEYNPDEWD